MRRYYTCAIAALTLASQAAAETVYAVDSRALLISFDSNLPAFVKSIALIKGLQPGEGIVGIDFRPANKKLYGLGSSSRIYTIDTAPGVVGSALYE